MRHGSRDPSLGLVRSTAQPAASGSYCVVLDSTCERRAELSRMGNVNDDTRNRISKGLNVITFFESWRDIVDAFVLPPVATSRPLASHQDQVTIDITGRMKFSVVHRKRVLKAGARAVHGGGENWIQEPQRSAHILV